MSNVNLNVNVYQHGPAQQYSGGPVPPPPPAYQPGSQQGNGAAMTPPIAATMKGGSSTLGTVAFWIYAVETAIDALVDTAKMLDSVFKELAETGKNYNAQIAVATAMANVKATFAEMKQANQLGPNLAEYVDARSDLSSSIKRLETTVVDQLIPVGTDIVKVMNAIVQYANNLGDKEWVHKVAQAVKDHPILYSIFQTLAKSPMHHAVESILKKVRDIADTLEDSNNSDQQEFFDLYRELTDPMSPVNQLPLQNPPFNPPVGRP